MNSRIRFKSDSNSNILKLEYQSSKILDAADGSKYSDFLKRWQSKIR
jgi:hypothetical protein